MYQPSKKRVLLHDVITHRRVDPGAECTPVGHGTLQECSLDLEEIVGGVQGFATPSHSCEQRHLRLAEHSVGHPLDVGEVSSFAQTLGDGPDDVAPLEYRFLGREPVRPEQCSAQSMRGISGECDRSRFA